MNNFSKLTAFLLFFALSSNFVSYGMEQEDHDDFVSWQTNGESKTTNVPTEPLLVLEQYKNELLNAIDADHMDAATATCNKLSEYYREKLFCTQEPAILDTIRRMINMLVQNHYSDGLATLIWIFPQESEDYEIVNNAIKIIIAYKQGQSLKGYQLKSVPLQLKYISPLSQTSLLDQCYTSLYTQKKKALGKLLKKFCKKHMGGLPRELLDPIITRLFNTRGIGFINTVYASLPITCYPFLALKLVDANSNTFDNSEKREALAILKNIKKFDNTNKSIKKILASLKGFCPKLTNHSAYYSRKSSWSLEEIKGEILSSCENEDVVNFLLKEDIAISNNVLFNFLYNKCNVKSEEQANFAIKRLKLLLSHGCNCSDKSDHYNTPLEKALNVCIDQIDIIKKSQTINKAYSLPASSLSNNLLILLFRLKVIRILVKNAIKLNINFKDINPELEIENQNSLSIDELVEILIEKMQAIMLEAKRKADEQMRINRLHNSLFPLERND